MFALSHLLFRRRWFVDVLGFSGHIAGPYWLHDIHLPFKYDIELVTNLPVVKENLLSIQLLMLDTRRNFSQHLLILVALVVQLFEERNFAQKRCQFLDFSGAPLFLRYDLNNPFKLGFLASFHIKIKFNL